MPVVKRVEDAKMPYLMTLAQKVESAGEKSLRHFRGVKKETDSSVEIKIEGAAEDEGGERRGETALSQDSVRDRNKPEGHGGDLNRRSEPNSFRFPVVVEEGGEEEDTEEDAQHHGQVKIPPKRIAGESAEDARQITAHSRHGHSREVQTQPKRRNLHTMTREQMKSCREGHAEGVAD